MSDEKDLSINYDEIKRKKKLEKELGTDRAHKQYKHNKKFISKFF